jgi:hypothetical protein
MIPRDLSAELLHLVPDDGLELLDLLGREKGAQRLPPQLMQLVARRRETVTRVAKAAGEICRLVAPPCTRVELLVVVRIVDVQFRRRNADNGPCATLFNLQPCTSGGSSSRTVLSV